MARLGQILAIEPGNVTPIWPASGFALTIALWRGYRTWLGLWVGVFFFGLTVLFSLLTLPVEFDASRRGLKMLDEAGLFVSQEEAKGARSVLTAAALTYVAAFITSMLQFLYYVRVARNS